MESYWTRAQLVRRAAAAGIGIAAGGRVGAGFLDLGVDDVASAATARLGPHHAFTSRPDLRPPIVSVLHHKRGATADGLIFMAPLAGPGERGTMLVDDAGEIVYFHSTKPVVGLNFRAATYRGKPVLTWWEGKTEKGLGDGTHVVLDQHYRVVARIPAGAGRHSDLHEFLITHRNTALVTAWERVEADLTAFGGPSRGIIIGGVVQELALPSGRVLFEWRSLDHVKLEESYVSPGDNFFDYFHINSIELGRDGNYLVSARNTWAVYKIDGQTGKVLWRLGGKRSDFQMGPGTVFAWQHDARMHPPGNLLSLFDDGSAPTVQPHSKAIVLRLDGKRMRATLHRSYAHHPPVTAHALGSMQVLPNGNVFVGWGTAPYFSEHTDSGRLVFDATLPTGGENYRALRFPWRGTPYYPPDIVATRRANYHLVHVSWNGSTEVAKWQLEVGPRPGSLTVLRTVPKLHFETRLGVPPGTAYARVTALDEDGAPLAHSRTLHLT
jgi:hypothetical protein